MANSGLNIAAQYLASRRPVAPLDPSVVMSDNAQRTLGAIPALNAQLAADLAKQTLQQVGETTRSKMQWDAWAKAQRLPYEKMTKADQATVRQNRRTAMINALSNMGGLDGGGGRREAIATALLNRGGGGITGDPLGQVNNLTGTTMSTLTGMGVDPFSGDTANARALKAINAYTTGQPPASGDLAPSLPDRPAYTPVATRTSPPVSMPQAQGVAVTPTISAEQDLLRYWAQRDAAQARSTPPQRQG